MLMQQADGKLQALKGFKVDSIEKNQLGETTHVDFNFLGPNGEHASLSISEAGELHFWNRLIQASNKPLWRRICANVKAKRDLFLLTGLLDEAAITRALEHEELESGVDLSDFKVEVHQVNK